MSIELRDGERLLKLKESCLDSHTHHKENGHVKETDLTVVRLWQLLTGGQPQRDGTVGDRHFL